MDLSEPPHQTSRLPPFPLTFLLGFCGGTVGDFYPQTHCPLKATDYTLDQNNYLHPDGATITQLESL